jgi:Protein of unknown function (DUF2442)
MHEHAAAEKDQASALIPPIVTNAADNVRDVIPLPGYRLAVRFNDGTAGIVYMAQLVSAPRTTMFTPLYDPSLFSQVTVEFGVVTWPGEIDLAPDVMYSELQERGEWILTANG